MRTLSALSLLLLLLLSPASWAASEDMGRVSKDEGSQTTTEDMGRVSLSAQAGAKQG